MKTLRTLACLALLTPAYCLAVDSTSYITKTGVTTMTPGQRLVKNASGTAASSGNNTIVAAVSGKQIKVFAFALLSNSTNTVTAKFQNGASGNDLWAIPLMSASTSTYFGANLASAIPSFLFATDRSTLLNLNLSSANTVFYSISYWEEDQ